MKLIKKICIYLVMIMVHNFGISSTKNSPEFDKVMKAFTQDFEKFAQVYHHGTKKEKQDLYRYAIAGLKSAFNLKKYVASHQHEKRFVSEEKRQELQKIVDELPRPTKKQVQDFQKHTKTFGTLLSDCIDSSKKIPLDIHDKNYKTSVIDCLQKVTGLNKFIAQHPGLFIYDYQKKELIKVLDRLKSIFPKLKHADIKKSDPQHRHAVKKVSPEQVTPASPKATLPEPAPTIHKEIPQDVKMPDSTVEEVVKPEEPAKKPTVVKNIQKPVAKKIVKKVQKVMHQNSISTPAVSEPVKQAVNRKVK